MQSVAAFARGALVARVPLRAAAAAGVGARSLWTRRCAEVIHTGFTNHCSRTSAARGTAGVGAGSRRWGVLQQRRCLSTDHYNVLGVKKTATQDEIKKAYLDLSKKHHPDKTLHLSKKEQKASHAKFVSIAAAFEILSDPVSRREYDYDSGQSDGSYRGHNPWGPVKYDTGYSRPTPSAENPYYGHRYGFDENIKPSGGESPYKKVSDGTVVLLAVCLMLISIIYHKFSFDKHSAEALAVAEAQSKQAAAALSAARATAKQHSPEDQIRLLRERIEGQKKKAAAATSEGQVQQQSQADAQPSA